MGIEKLIKTGKTEETSVKTESKDTEMKIAKPVLGHPKVDENTMPSVFDSMYLSPTLEIKGQSPATTKYGTIAPTGEEEGGRKKIPGK